MNLLMASVLLLAMLAFQPTLIYGTKNLAATKTGASSSLSFSSDSSRLTKNNRNIRSPKYGKRHSTESLFSPALSSSSAKLVMSMESGDVLVRAARGAALDQNQNLPPVNGQHNDGKRQKNNNKKLNKNLPSQEGTASVSTPSSPSSPSSSSPSSSSAVTSTNRRKHLEKKFSAASGSKNIHQQQQQQQQPHLTKQQQHANANKGNGKQRQMLKSQNHQNKRSGGKANKEHVEKTQSESEKPSTTCRYAKSAWSECDPKTNMRSRTLTLKKGEPNCLETRTMQKKCKKSCRYEKGAWSECTNGQMTREDKLKTTAGGVESSCEAVRSINKKCNPHNSGSKQANGSGGGAGGKKERKNKEKGGSRRVVKN